MRKLLAVIGLAAAMLIIPAEVGAANRGPEIKIVSSPKPTLVPVAKGLL